MSNVVEVKARDRAQTKQSLADQDMIRQIEQLIRGQHGPSIILTITPSVARWIIENKNLYNRSKKPTKIAEYAGYMQESNWKLSGDTLKFSNLGYLRDGQNRLLACIRANKTFITHVVFGIDDAVFPWLDRTKPRSPADTLDIDGVGNAKQAAATIRWLEMLRTDRVKERITLTPPEALEAFKQHYDATRLDASMKAGRKVWSADQTPASLAAALHYQFATVNPALASEFFDAWATRNFSGRMKPIRKASEFLANLHTASNGRVHDVVRAAVWVIAWRFVVERRAGTMPDFRWKRDQPFPKIKG